MRLVSLCPSITALLFDLGVGDSLVGITKYCIHPADKVTHIEKVGGTKDPKNERIIELKPDLVFLNKEENRKEDWHVLESAGLLCHLSMPLTIRETIEFVIDVGKAVQQEQKAAEIAADIEQAWTSVKETQYTRTWAYLIWRKPYMSINGQTYISHLLSETGATNVFHHHEQLYPAIDGDTLAKANPDLILLSSEPFPFKEKHRDELATLTGLPKDRFILVDGELLSWHGSLTAKGLRYAQALMAGENR